MVTFVVVLVVVALVGLALSWILDQLSDRFESSGFGILKFLGLLVGSGTLLLIFHAAKHPPS